MNLFAIHTEFTHKCRFMRHFAIKNRFGLFTFYVIYAIILTQLPHTLFPFLFWRVRLVFIRRAFFCKKTPKESPVGLLWEFAVYLTFICRWNRCGK